MESADLKAKIARLFGDDLGRLSEEQLAERISKISDQMPLEKVEAISKTLDAEIKDLESVSSPIELRQSAYILMSTIAASAAIGFAVYNFVPAADTLKGIIEDGLELAFDFAQGRLAEYPRELYVEADKMARSAQGLLVGVGSFVVEVPIFSSIFYSGSSVHDLNYLPTRRRVYRNTKAILDSVLHNKYKNLDF